MVLPKATKAGLANQKKVRKKGMLNDKTRVMLDMGRATVGAAKPAVPSFNQGD